LLRTSYGSPAIGCPRAASRAAERPDALRCEVERALAHDQALPLAFAERQLGAAVISGAGSRAPATCTSSRRLCLGDGSALVDSFSDEYTASWWSGSLGVRVAISRGCAAAASR
jgi:hypothetical protein